MTLESSRHTQEVSRAGNFSLVSRIIMCLLDSKGCCCFPLGFYSCGKRKHTYFSDSVWLLSLKAEAWYLPFQSLSCCLLVKREQCECELRCLVHLKWSCDTYTQTLNWTWTVFFHIMGLNTKVRKKFFLFFFFLFQQIASAGSHKTHCKGHNIVQRVNRAIKVCAYFSSLTGSDWYSKCLTTLERIPTVRPFCWRVRSFV